MFVLKQLKVFTGCFCTVVALMLVQKGAGRMDSEDYTEAKEAEKHCGCVVGVHGTPGVPGVPGSMGPRGEKGKHGQAGC